MPLLLSGGENQVAALDFHLVFDPAVFEPVAVEPGPAALRADKMVTANAAEPGRYIVVVLGLNQTPLE
ncbi:MAG TPA: cohesin domain-containing protein, partial [Candidatus Hydrogenedentes bacterium]|nr:cohesin domain-containing protein [Candidatus Hydrogenedentota bacterium]